MPRCCYKKVGALLHDYVEGLICENVTITKSRPDVKIELLKTSKLFTSDFRSQYALISSAYKNFIKNCLGAHYVKTGYSPEYLVKSVLKYGGIRSKNCVMDLVNITQLRTGVPLAVLDLSKVTLPLVIRCSTPMERLIERKGKVMLLTGSEAVLTDATNNILYVMFSKVSMFYKVSNNAKQILIIATGVPSLPKYLVVNAITQLKNLFEMFYPEIRCYVVGKKKLLTSTS